VFCPSVRWLQRILDVCQAYAESHGIIFSCNKTLCMTFKAKGRITPDAKRTQSKGDATFFRAKTRLDWTRLLRMLTSSWLLNMKRLVILK